MTVKVKLTALAKLSREYPEAVKEGLIDAAQDIYQISQQLVPVDTGLLKESGKVVIITDKRVAVSYGEGISDQRAAAQEYGTVFHAAQPYLTPARKQVNVSQHVREAIRRRIK